MSAGVRREGHDLTLRFAPVATDARDLRPACLLPCIGGLCRWLVNAGQVWGSAPTPWRGVRGMASKSPANAQSDLISVTVIDVLILDPMHKPGMVFIHQR